MTAPMLIAIAALFAAAPYDATFDTANNSYSLTDAATGAVVAHPMDARPYTNDFATGRNAQLAGVAVTALVMGAGTLTTLTFDTYGKPVISADFVITLTYNGQAMTVTVKKGTGDVSIAG